MRQNEAPDTPSGVSTPNRRKSMESDQPPKMARLVASTKDVIEAASMNFNLQLSHAFIQQEFAWLINKNIFDN